MLIPRKNLIRVLLMVAAILLIPFVMTINDRAIAGGWKWGPLDFVVMGVLLFVTGLAMDIAWRKFATPARRIGAIVLIAITFLAIWTELAVDSVGQLITFIVS